MDLSHYSYVVEKSESILIVGGGTVGVELAGEIFDSFPGKKITIINSQPRLIPRSPPRAIEYVEKFFVKNGIELVLDHRLVEQNGKIFKTNKGAEIYADIAFWCTGNVPNTEFLQKDFPDYLNSQGMVKVNSYLQIPTLPNAFFAGDITDLPSQEEKLCQTASQEVSVVLQNIWNKENNLPLTTFSASPCPMLISLGKYECVFSYRGYSFGGFIPACIKEFVEWKEMVYYLHMKDMMTRSLSYLDQKSSIFVQTV